MWRGGGTKSEVSKDLNRIRLSLRAVLIAASNIERLIMCYRETRYALVSHSDNKIHVVAEYYSEVLDDLVDDIDKCDEKVFFPIEIRVPYIDEGIGVKEKVYYIEKVEELT